MGAGGNKTIPRNTYGLWWKPNGKLGGRKERKVQNGGNVSKGKVAGWTMVPHKNLRGNKKFVGGARLTGTSNSGS